MGIPTWAFGDVVIPVTGVAGGREITAEGKNRFAAFFAG